MARYLGFWNNDLSKENVRNLYIKGFNSIFMGFGYYWNQVKDDATLDFPSKQTHAIQNLVSDYQEFKKMGYKKFIIDGGWGMNEPDAIWKRISDALNGEDIIMYAGEFPETFVEKHSTSRNQATCLN